MGRRGVLDRGAMDNSVRNVGIPLMLPTKPDLSKFLGTDGVEELTFGGPEVGQPQYLPLPALMLSDGRIVSQWQPDAGELALLALGVPVTLELQTKGKCFPTRLSVGGINLNE